MKRLVFAVAAVAAAGTLFTATSAAAAPSQVGRSRAAAVRAPQAAVASVTPASAAVPATYNSACGSGYSVIDHLPLTGEGNVYLTYNSSTGYNCVVTVRDQSGAGIFMGADIAIYGDGNSSKADQGVYTTYAGPVYLYAAGECINWGGFIDKMVNGQSDSHCK